MAQFEEDARTIVIAHAVLIPGTMGLGWAWEDKAERSDSGGMRGTFLQAMLLNAVLQALRAHAGSGPLTIAMSNTSMVRQLSGTEEAESGRLRELVATIRQEAQAHEGGVAFVGASDVAQGALRQRTADEAKRQANRYAADESLAPSGIAEESMEALSPSAAPSPAAHELDAHAAAPAVIDTDAAAIVVYSKSSGQAPTGWAWADSQVCEYGGAMECTPTIGALNAVLCALRAHQGDAQLVIETNSMVANIINTARANGKASPATKPLVLAIVAEARRHEAVEFQARINHVPARMMAAAALHGEKQHQIYAAGLQRTPRGLTAEAAEAMRARGFSVDGSGLPAGKAQAFRRPELAGMSNEQMLKSALAVEPLGAAVRQAWANQDAAALDAAVAAAIARGNDSAVPAASAPGAGDAGPGSAQGAGGAQGAQDTADGAASGASPALHAVPGASGGMQNAPEPNAADAPSAAATHSEAAWNAAGSTPPASYQPRHGKTASAEIAPVLSPTTAGLLEETAADFRAAARELRDTAAGAEGETRDSLLFAADTYERTATLVDDFRARCIAA